MMLPNRQFRIRIATSLLAIESLVIFGLAIYLVFKNFTATNTSDARALSGEIGAALIGAAFFSFLTINLYKGKRFTFAPIILLNLIIILNFLEGTQLNVIWLLTLISIANPESNFNNRVAFIFLFYILIIYIFS